MGEGTLFAMSVTGILSGYFCLILSASAFLFSKGCSAWKLMGFIDCNALNKERGFGVTGGMLRCAR
jgi:hypothetical protein